MSARGFTLIELLVTLTVLGLLVTMGLPNLSKQVRESRTKTQTLELYQAVQLARTRAITTNSRATLRALGSWEQGWQLFLDPDNNGVLGSGEALIAEGGPSNGLRIEGNQPLQNYISFIGTGEARFATGGPRGGIQMGTLTVCPRIADGSGYKLVLARSGRMRMSAIPPDECL